MGSPCVTLGGVWKCRESCIGDVFFWGALVYLTEGQGTKFLGSEFFDVAVMR